MMLTFPEAKDRDRIAHANAFAEKLRQQLSSEAVVRRDEPLAKRTTLRVGGPADVFVEPACIEDLALVLRACVEDTMPLFLIGRGSNLIVRDGGFKGVVVSLSHERFCAVEKVDEGLRAGAGARLKRVAVEARNVQLSGFEFLEGIPGTLGGALRMNAGAMGSCIFELADSVEFMNQAGEIVTRRGAELGASYRNCEFFETHAALFALLKGSPAQRSDIERRMLEFSKKRWSSQPAAPSAGCMFKNPEGTAAGKLIDELGLKGTRVGGAVVSQEHGNFLVAGSTATSRDVIELIQLVRWKVREARGIDLESEVQIIGEDVEPAKPFAETVQRA